MPQRNFGGPLRRLGRNESLCREPGESFAGQRFNCGFEDLVAERAYRQIIDAHGQYVLVYILGGEGEFCDNAGRPARFGPGDAFQRYPGGHHEMALAGGMRLTSCFVTIPDALFSVLRLENAIPTLGAAVLHPGRRPEIPARLDEILTELRQAPPGELGRVLLWTHTLLMDLYRWHRQAAQPAPDEARLGEARRRLGEDLEERLPLAELARELGWGYSKFRKDFRARTGLSPGDYRIRCRIERAQELLGGGELSVKEIAFRLGYPDVQAFSRQFRRVAGLSPRQFQQSVFPHLRASVREAGPARNFA